MKTETLFKELACAQPTSDHVNITFNGNALTVPANVTVAAALLGAGVRQFRKSPVGQQARAPYCMMGVCFECLLEIDGLPSQQSCLINVREGMQIKTMEHRHHLSNVTVSEGENHE